MFHAGLLRKAMEGTRKVEDAARRRTECEDGVPEPSSTYQAVAIWEIEEMYSLVGGLCALGTEAPVAATSEDVAQPPAPWSSTCGATPSWAWPAY